jgi:hypothetical protein
MTGTVVSRIQNISISIMYISMVVHPKIPFLVQESSRIRIQPVTHVQIVHNTEKHEVILSDFN